MQHEYKNGTHEEPFGSSTILCDNSTVPRPILPIECRKPNFLQFHNLAHSNWKTTTRLILARFSWPNARKDINAWCKECLACQQSKITRHCRTTPQQINDASGRFTHVHMDIEGPLPAVPASPHRYLVTYIDRATNWVEADPVSSITATEIAQSFIRTWFSRFGVPLYLTTDRGKQFESELFAELAKTIGFCRLRTTAYHPQSNGKIERFHRFLKAALIAQKCNWIKALPIVLFGHRIAPNDKNISPMSTTTGVNILLPPTITGKLPKTQLNSHFVQELNANLELLAYNRHSTSNRSFPEYIPTDLRNADFVWLRVDRVKKPLEAYTGPHKVLKMQDKTAIISINDRPSTVSITRLKPCHLKKTNSLRQKKQPEAAPSNIPTKYCICAGSYDREMTKCSNEQCPVGWYHNDCAGLSAHPLGLWYCSICASQFSQAASSKPTTQKKRVRLKLP